MRLRSDECIDERLRSSFPGHSCETAHYSKFVGLRNGEPLSAAEAAGFDVLLTVDQGIPDQQNLARRKISLLILVAPTNRLRDLRRLVPAALATLETIQPGQVKWVFE